MRSSPGLLLFRPPFDVCCTRSSQRIGVDGSETCPKGHRGREVHVAAKVTVADSEYRLSSVGLNPKSMCWRPLAIGNRQTGPIEKNGRCWPALDTTPTASSRW